MNSKYNIKKIESMAIYVYLGIYGFVSFIYLTRFPLVHSDEPWLAGLSDAYLDSKSIFVTETFFDLMPRTVHTIKSLYHLIQIPFISIFGHSIQSVRIPSLIGALLSLYFLYLILNRLFNIRNLSLMVTILLSLNLQFIYASHFARQEMLLFMILTLAYLLYLIHPKKTYIPGLLIGLSIALHPNAFILAMMIGLLIFIDTLLKKQTFNALLFYILPLVGFALFHLGISLLVNPDFLSQYFAYGQTLGVDATFVSRLENFKDFYLKLYYQVTGTYYIPPLKNFFRLYAIILIFSMTLFFIKKQPFYTFSHPIFMFLAFNMGIYIIGRYNTTSVLFIVLPFYLLLGYWGHLCYKYKKTVIPFIMALFLGLISLSALYQEITRLSSHNYNNYLKEIKTYITDDSIILGNLSSGFIFKDNLFYDIRNLNYLDNLTLEDYMKSRQINTIIYYEEYGYIERNPQWSILYGDGFKPSLLQKFLNEKATLTHTFIDTYYGSRIIKYMGDYPWKIYIYSLEP